MSEIRAKINEKVYIELYNSDKSTYELSRLFGISERTASRYEQRLRIKGKVKPRKELQTNNKLGLDKIKISDIDKKIKLAKQDWQIPKLLKSKKENEDFKIYLYVADQHVPEYNTPANKAVHNLMDDIQFDGFRIVGDFMDMSPISHWNEHKRKTLETQRLKEHYAIGNVLLDEYDKRLPKNCDKAYFWGNHECLDEQTELLTKRGWINYSEIQKLDKVYSFNPKTEKGEWVNIERIIIKTFSGLLNRLKTDTIDLLATDNHKIFSKDRITGKYNYIEIKNLKKKRYLIPITPNNKYKGVDINDDYLTLIGWILTDGSITKENYIRIYQSEQKAKLIRNLLLKLNLKFGEYSRNREIKSIGNVALKTIQKQYTFNISAKDSQDIMILLDRKKQLPSWVSNLTNRQFKVLLYGLILGDGSRHLSAPKTSLMLFGKKKFLEDVQLQCIFHGWACSLSTYRETQYRLNVTKRLFYNLEYNNQIKKEYYNGDIWDLTVKNHNFLIRRNGKCHFTGNSWYNDLIEKLPVLEGMLNPTEELYLVKRGYKVYENMNYIEKIGRLSVTHGVYATIHAVRKHIQEFKTNVMFFHTHRMGSRTETSPAKEIAIVGYNVPCLCNKNPDYLRNRPNAWTHGFAIVYYLSNEHFFVQNIRIVQGKFVYNSKLYDGTK